MNKSNKVSREDQEYLDRMERKVEQAKVQDELDREQRKREQEKLRNSYNPKQPLYGKSVQPEDKSSQRNDPRYKEYFDRLKKSRPDTAGADTGYDDAVDSISMDDLDSHEWTPKKPTSNPPPSTRSIALGATQNRQKTAPLPADLAPGSIVRIDDGSIAIFKDAVSGKDYALFYFLERDGSMEARGIFLQQYESRRIGHMPTDLFDKMCKAGRWDRDAIIFHLERFEYTRYIKAISTVRDRLDSSEFHDTPAERDSVVGSPVQQKPPSLEKGRHFRINFSGRIWDAVYWTSDAMGSIVAHNTLGKWSLMHLDLKRFNDSLELGDMASEHETRQIEKSLAVGA